MATDRGKGGLHKPTDRDFKTGGRGSLSSTIDYIYVRTNKTQAQEDDVPLAETINTCCRGRDRDLNTDGNDVRLGEC
eukprot:scaffold28113_cov146-Skeletonema_marinoi.AAC.2